MIAVIDYGVGNLFSLKSSFAALGLEAVVTSDPLVLAKADHIVLPGVGAFGDAAEKLKTSGLWDVVKSEAHCGKPLLGICLGMQLLLEKSYEFGEFEGLGLIPGEVKPIAEKLAEKDAAEGSSFAADLKIPQMGWNSLIMTNDSPIFKDTKNGEFMYFVHSYFCDAPAENVTSVCEYGAKLTASVQNGNVYGCQFHPEKSGPAGLRILSAFASL